MTTLHDDILMFKDVLGEEYMWLIWVEGNTFC